MKAVLCLVTLVGLGLADPAFGVSQAVLFSPNTGGECTLTCKNLVPIDQCNLKGCKMSQYGCLDRDGKSCGRSSGDRGTYCVVDGPCGAGASGCLDDATGQDNHLPPGTHKGHCPADGDQCSRCREAAGSSCKDPNSRRCFLACMRQCETCDTCLLKYPDRKSLCYDLFPRGCNLKGSRPAQVSEL